jgi:hypothetical protein
MPDVAVIEMIDVVGVKATGPSRLRVRFSDGSEGETDLAGLLAQTGSMLVLLRDADYFARVFVDLGAPTWPNGFALDPIALHSEMKAAGELGKSIAAELPDGRSRIDIKQPASWRP